MKVKLPKTIVKDNETYYLSLNYTPVYAKGERLVWHWWADYSNMDSEKKYFELPFNGETFVNLNKYELKVLDYLNSEKSQGNIYFED